MSKDGISAAFYSSLMDTETRHSVLKELRTKAAEKEFKNKLKDKKLFRGIILRVNQSRFPVAGENGSGKIDERPVFYQAWIRIEEIDAEIIPNKPPA